MSLRSYQIVRCHDVQVSEHIDVYYDGHEKQVYAAVDGREALLCAALVASISPSDPLNDDMNSIDDIETTNVSDHHF